MVYTFDDANAPGRHRTQYFEMLVNRGIYQDGWWAAARASIPWDSSIEPFDPDSAVWELYNLDQDYSQADNLAAKEPAKLRELQEFWWAEAARHSVLPLDGRKVERLNAEMQGRPSLAGNRTKMVYYPGMKGLPAGSAPNVLNKSFSITAEIEMTADSNQGAVFSLGGSDSGYGIYIRDRQPVFVGNFLGRSIVRAASNKPLPDGPARLRGEFKYDGGGIGKGGTLKLFVNDQPAGEARMDQTVGITLGLGGTLDVGLDTGSPVDDAYTPPFEFQGTIKQVTVELGK
jgi:arylsulfatase